MNQQALIAAAAASLLSTLLVATPAAAQDKEKCYGIAKAGTNDCSNLSGTHTCAGQSKADFQYGDWRYVPNPSGGFLGFWWNNEGIEGGEIYLQLEEDALVAKIWAETPERRGELRERWFRRVAESIPGFTRPKRFGNGEYMTVATHGDYRIKSPDGRLDLEATVRALQATTAALSRLVAASAKS